MKKLPVQPQLEMFKTGYLHNSEMTRTRYTVSMNLRSSAYRKGKSISLMNLVTRALSPIQGSQGS